MLNKKHIVVFSHGFGVRKDDRGTLSGVAEGLPEVESILFDYYDVNEDEKTITIRPFSEKVAMLNQVIEKARLDNPGAIIDLICHSQGTVVTALAKPEGIRKTIFLAPPFDMDVEKSFERYRSKPGTVIDLEGVSRLYPVDGLTRLVPAKYWQERRAVRVFDEYNAFAAKTEIIAIIANQDEILPKVDLKELSSRIKVIYLDGNHGFSGEARGPLVNMVRGYIIGIE